MDSLFVLLSTGESKNSFAEGRGSTSVGVRYDARRDSIKEAKCVELVEKGLGGGQGAQRRFRQLVEHAPRSLFELRRRKNAGDESNRFRLVSADDAASRNEIKRDLLTNVPPKHRHHHRGNEADRYFRVRELRILVRQHDVARRREAGPAGKRASFDEGDDRLLHPPDSMEHVPERLGVVDVVLAWGVDHFLESSEIRTRAKIGTFPINGYDAHRAFAEREKSLGQLVGRCPVERVLLSGASESDEPNRTLDRDDDVVHRALADLRAATLGSPRRLASESGTSIVIRNNAVEYTFPCASVFSDKVPPPSRAPWSRKLRALRFGSSYRSTSPSIIPRKCSATRSTVTCCRST